VYNIYPSGNAYPQRFTVYNGKLYFTASDAAHGDELWVYDGTTTTMVDDLNPGVQSSGTSDFQVWNNTI
jgi:ELWxxDGT repeat protein